MVEIFCNGAPKMGNHPLVKACQLLGLPCQVNHVTFEDKKLVVGKHIFIKRDPRNAVVAWLRMQGQPETPGMFLAAFRQFAGENRTLVESLAGYEPWLTDPSTLVVSYEALLASDAELKRIAAWVGVPYIEGAFENIPGLTRTWTGPNHSDYRKVFTPEVAEAWVIERGPELLERWGY